MRGSRVRADVAVGALAVSAALLLPTPCRAGEDLVVDTSGRCLQRSWRATPAGATVLVRGGAGASYRLLIRYVDGYLSTAAVTEKDAELEGKVAGVDKLDLQFDLPDKDHPLAGHPMAIYGLIRGGKTDPALVREGNELAEKGIALRAVRAETPEQKAYVVAKAREDAAKAARDAKAPKLRAEIEALDRTIAIASDEIKAYAGMSTEGAVSMVRTLQQDVRNAKERRQSASADLDGLEAAAGEAAKLQAAVDALPISVQLAALKAREDEVSALLTSGRAVLREGVLFLAPAQKPIYYDSAAFRNKERPLTLERLAPFPPITQDDSLFVVLVNERRDNLKEPYFLSYTLASEPPLNPTLVRPTFKFELQAGEEDLKLIRSGNAFADAVLPFGRTFPANTVLSVSVTTLREVSTEKKTVTDKRPPAAGAAATTTTVESVTEQKSIKVLDGEKFPAVRGLYRFNFATGVLMSGVRDPSFVRVQTQLDNPATTPANEAAFADQLVGGDRSIKPVVLIAVYPKRVDIQAPVTWREAVIPAPTVGLAISSAPQDDVFVGFTHELLRNVQFVYGVHWGKVKQLSPRGVDNPSSTTAPATISRYERAGFVGLSFNLNFVRQIFK